MYRCYEKMINSLILRKIKERISECRPGFPTFYNEGISLCVKAIKINLQRILGDPIFSALTRRERSLNRATFLSTYT